MSRSAESEAAPVMAGGTADREMRRVGSLAAVTMRLRHASGKLALI